MIVSRTVYLSYANLPRRRQPLDNAASNLLNRNSDATFSRLPMCQACNIGHLSILYISV
jgi:hypothetical protein